MEDSLVPPKKEDHISGRDGEFFVTLMIDAVRYDWYFLFHMSREISDPFADTKPSGVVFERFLLLMFVWLRKKKLK